MEIYLLDEKIELTDGRIMYSKLKSDFRREAKIASDEFFDNYYNEMPNVDIYVNEVEKYGLRCIENALFNCSNFFISLGMFDFSPDFIFEDIKNGEGYFTEFLNELFFSKVEDIVNQHQREESYRSFRKDNRTEMVMVGGGSGVTGALTGMFKAGVVNMISGAAHSAINSVESKKSEQKLLEELNDLFFSKRNRNLLSYSIMLDIRESVDFAYEYVIDSGIVNDPYFVSDDDVEKTKRILENISRKKIPSNMEKKALIECIKSDPYNIESYGFYLRSYDFSEIYNYFLSHGLVVEDLLEFFIDSPSEIESLILNNNVFHLEDREIRSINRFLGMNDNGKQRGISASPVNKNGMVSICNAFSISGIENVYLYKCFSEEKIKIKINNFISKTSSFKNLIVDDIVVYMDETLFGKGDKGFVFTKQGEFICNIDGNFSIKIDEIKDVKIKGLMNKKIIIKMNNSCVYSFVITQSNKGAELVPKIINGYKFISKK